MLAQNWFVLFCACLLIIDPNPNGVEATRVLTIHRKGYSRGSTYSTLGLVCKCCDGKGGECRTTWEAVCYNLQCSPWKYQ
ncbi:hypothetical protein Lal_00022344, partial [Lupinus albus]